MSDRIMREDANGCCTLWLNRPDKLNALDTETFEALEAHLVTLEADDSIGCVVLRGMGKHFCAGADIGNINSALGHYKPGVIAYLRQLLKPTVAAVHGVCFTGALELALGCDFIIADATARFADTHGKWGLVGAWGMTQRLPRRISPSAAKSMMLTSRTVGAEEAKALGLIDALAPEGELDALVQRFTGEILANSWFTNAETKRMLLATEGMTLAQGLAHEFERHPGFAPDYQQRIERFTKK